MKVDGQDKSSGCAPGCTRHLAFVGLKRVDSVRDLKPGMTM